MLAQSNRHKAKFCHSLHMPEAKRLQELAGGSELLHDRDGHK